MGDDVEAVRFSKDQTFLAAGCKNGGSG